MDVSVAILNSIALRTATHCSQRTSVTNCIVISLASTTESGSIELDLLPTCCLRCFLMIEAVYNVDLLIAVALSQCSRVLCG